MNLFQAIFIKSDQEANEKKFNFNNTQFWIILVIFEHNHLNIPYMYKYMTACSTMLI